MFMENSIYLSIYLFSFNYFSFFAGVSVQDPAVEDQELGQNLWEQVMKYSSLSTSASYFVQTAKNPSYFGHFLIDITFMGSGFHIITENTQVIVTQIFSKSQLM